MDPQDYVALDRHLRRICGHTHRMTPISGMQDEGVCPGANAVAVLYLNAGAGTPESPVYEFAVYGYRASADTGWTNSPKYQTAKFWLWNQEEPVQFASYVAAMRHFVDYLNQHTEILIDNES